MRGEDLTSTTANARLVTDVVFETDRRGWGLFARLSGIHQRGISGQDSAAVIERHGYWSGPTVGPQRFVGLASTSTARPVSQRATEIGDARSAGLDDPARRIFAERMRRRSS